jgi:hypothetical protein
VRRDAEAYLLKLLGRSGVVRRSYSVGIPLFASAKLRRRIGVLKRLAGRKLYLNRYFSTAT